MNFRRLSAKTRALLPVLMTTFVLLFVSSLTAQETTGGLQGTVKDPSGAVVSNAQVVATASVLIGNKTVNSDSSGYYRFANLPPGSYLITVTARGFRTTKREGLNIEVGHVPTIDFALEVGGTETVVEVSGQAPVIDVTSNTNSTNMTSDVLDNTPHGYSFQSVIQFAPMARNEPLAGNTGAVGNNAVGAGGNGGSLPGSSGNGQNVGFSVGGAADSESSYLVEGQDTENVSGGFSQANVPFSFIQEVQVKTSGIEAEHGGALGGVVNVVMRKGGNAYHGSLFATWEGDSVDGSPGAYVRYNPGTPPARPLDQSFQTYQPKRDHFRIVQPGFTLGGPVVKDKVWFFLGFAPDYTSRTRTVNFGPAICNTPAVGGCPNQTLGNQNFAQDNQQYFTTARLDYNATSKIRLFASWLYQYTRESGSRLPRADSISSQNFLNSTNAIFTPLAQFSHGLGFSAPDTTYNFGGDITLTPHIVSTTRFGYFFNNYHDFGWPTSGVDLSYQYQTPATDNKGNAYPLALVQPGGASTTAYDQQFTEYNASKHYQFNQDLAFYHGGWWGTHNIKVGYQYNRLWNVINQHGNVPIVDVYLGTSANGIGYSPTTVFGGNQCAPLKAEWNTAIPPAPPNGTCDGEYGYATSADFSTVLKANNGAAAPAIDNNHALFVQDAWTVGHGLTLNLGLRVEKESLPAPVGVGIPNIKTISFSWSDKVEPRLGAAWGSRNGKLKIFGSYGVVNDVMKLLLAQTSFGAQRWNNCTYPLGPNASGTFNNSDVTIQPLPYFNGCPVGGPSAGANFANGVVPTVFTDKGTGIQLIENTNFRPEEPVSPGVKPYRQHEFVGGVDYQLGKDWAIEARYDRRRLDHAIEDSSLSAPCCFEFYTIVNPGENVNKTLDGYANYLRSLGAGYGPGVPPFDPLKGFDPTGICANGGCPNMPLAVRNYDGLEFRLTKSMSHGFAGMFSYTWSRLWGNYPGLTTTDQTDGGATGRNSPDTSRSFDEPFYYFTYKGTSANGPLPTDRPSALKGNVYYQLPFWSKTQTTTLGLFQVAYQGSPVSSFSDIGYGAPSSPIEATYAWGRGNWVNATANPATGLITLGNTYARRTPWYTQTDFNLSHNIKVNKNNEAQVLTFNATVTNLFNQHSVVAYWQGLNSDFYGSALFQFGLFAPGGAAYYKSVETGYSPQGVLNAQQSSLPVTLNSQYGQPNQWQFSRNMRLGVTFTF
jgi:outer membrane receptor protein involved in Fe transport